jgi:outer membrane protein assembly factor BamB
MPGHDPARSSWASQDKVESVLRPIWQRKIGPYIPSKVQIITVAAAGRVPALVLVSTSRGMYALDPADGHELWCYPTEMPIDQSPTVVGGVVYFGSTDKTVHALDAVSGKRIWQTLRAGAAFDTNPVVADNRVLLGCRDGYFYAFDAATGSLLWSYRAGGPISFSAAYDRDAVYFADKHNYVYALNARDGKLIWKSPQLPGAGFLSWWPVLSGQRILVPGTNNFAKGQGGPSLHELNNRDMFPAGAKRLELIGPQDAEGWIDARRVVEYYRQHPERQTLHVLDRATGQPAETAPIVFWGNSNDNRLPPLVGPDGQVFTSTAWAYDPNYLQGRIAAWKMGTTLLKPFTEDLESFDEIDVCAMIGQDIITYNRGGDGADGGGLFVRGRRSRDRWDKQSLRQAFPDYAAAWEDWKYGNEPREGPAGTHGYQNPPVPLNGRVYFHRSNSVICYGIDSGAKNEQEQVASLAGGGRSKTLLTVPGLTGEPAGKLPTVRLAEELLADEIERMIEAGHLRPVVANPSEQYWQVMRHLRGANMIEYWHNPAETIYTLLRALPHVPAAMRGPLKAYIQREWREYPPYEYTSTGWGGASREIFPIPPEMQEYYTGKGGRTAQKPSGQPAAGWTAWSFHPFNFYACWLYAREFGGAEEVLARISSRLQPPPADKVTRDKPHVLNCYVAGYIGYLGLEQLVGRPPSENVRQWLRETQDRRVAMLAMDPREVYTTEAGGFLYLVPEFGEYLHEHALPGVAKHVGGYNDLAPLWFLSEADEVSRAVARKGCPEGSLAQFYDYASLFAAKALALKARRQELEKYLDVPGVWRGDLFYIQNLVATIEAH